MFRFLLRRILEAIPALLVIATATFFMVRWAPGGPFSDERKATPEVLRNLEQHYGLDRPLWRQYLDYMGDLARGDFGPSYKYYTHTVNEIIAGAFPVSLQLGLCALLVALALGLPAGVISAMRPGAWFSGMLMALAMLGICLPTFVLGPLLALALAIHLQWFNVSGFYSWRDLVLPGLTLGGYYAAYVARLTRAGMMEVLAQDFIRTARAKGVPEWRVIVVHALRGGLTPVVAFMGPAIAGLITGSFVVETIFQLPGLGQFFVKSALNRDYFLVSGTVVFYGALILLCNLLADVGQAWLNPKVRLE